MLIAIQDPVEAVTSSSTCVEAPSDGGSHERALTVALGSPPACTTVTTRPATVNVPVRGCVGEVGATTTAIVALPCPLEGETVSQGTVLATDHEASGADAVKATSRVPPGASSDSVVGSTEKPGTTPAWTNVTRCPASVTVPVRACTDTLAAARTRTDPGPVPACTCAVSQGADDVMLHALSGSELVTVSGYASPVDGTSTRVGATVT